MTLTPGTKLGTFEVGALIGEGGMGQVYRARDTKLDREVAIKVLPEVFAKDSERLARFEREAKMLAALNHASIAGIFDFQAEGETKFLVMELVEGETLEERLREGPLTIEDAVTIFSQIAEALEAAHEQGIVHRDLKPANTKITAAGRVKLLDFGLAKAWEGRGESQSGATIALGATVSPGITAEGKLLGTPAYMSPEQARGRPADKRADIWAFGCCLFEALTAKRPFSGETISDLVAEILKGEPDWSALPAETPSRIRDLLWRCLQKDPRRRLRDIGEAWFELSETSSDSSGGFALDPPPTAEKQTSMGRMAAIGLVGIAIGAAVAALIMNDRGASGPPAGEETVSAEAALPLRRLPINLPFSDYAGDTGSLRIAISPTGTHIAYVDERSRLYLRPLAELEFEPVPGVVAAQGPFFSPDGKWIGFWSPNGTLQKVAIDGGAAVTLCRAPIAFWGPSWGEDGYIYFNPLPTSGISRVRAEGGEPEPLTEPNRERGEFGHWFPRLLPGGRAMLVMVIGLTRGRLGSDIAVYEFQTKELRVLIENAHHARYAPTGHLVFGRERRLMAVPFDLESLTSRGAPVEVLSSLEQGGAPGQGQYGFSRDGTLVYIPAVHVKTPVWVDAEGKEEPVRAPARLYGGPALSPDGQSLAVVTTEGSNTDIRLLDFGRSTLSRLTLQGSASSPVWSRDGSTVYFMRIDETGPHIARKPADRSRDAEVVLEVTKITNPFSISPDGKLLALQEFNPMTGSFDILILPLEEGGEPMEFDLSPFSEGKPMISPDGKWLAYTSNESGGGQVYAGPFPEGGRKIPISVRGGDSPRWSPDGKRIFYRAGRTMMAVDVETEPEFEAGEPVMLFEGVYDLGGVLSTNYDVSADGERFLMIKGEAGKREAGDIVLVQGWFEELKRLVPTGRLAE